MNYRNVKILNRKTPRVRGANRQNIDSVPCMRSVWAGSWKDNPLLGYSLLNDDRRVYRGHV